MAGTLSIVVNGTINGFGVPYNGAGNLYGAVTAQRSTPVTYSGSGTLSASTAFGYARSTALSGSGTLAASGYQNYFMNYQEVSDGTLAATTTSQYYQVKTMALSGGGTLAATAAQVAVTYDNDVTAGSATVTVGATTKTLTWNHVNAGNYIFVAITNSGNAPSATVTCNGNAMSYLGQVTNGSNIRLYLYGTNNLIVGTNAMQIVASGLTSTGYFLATSISYNAMSSTGSLMTTASTTSSATITGIPTTANGYLLRLFAMKNSGEATDGGYKWSVGGNNSGIYQAGDSYATAGSTVSTTVNIGVTNPITFAFEARSGNPWVMMVLPINR